MKKNTFSLETSQAKFSFDVTDDGAVMILSDVSCIVDGKGKTIPEMEQIMAKLNNLDNGSLEAFTRLHEGIALGVAHLNNLRNGAYKKQMAKEELN